MTNAELIKTLRWCDGENNEWCVCETYKCPLWAKYGITGECKVELMTSAADALESAEKKIEELERGFINRGSIVDDLCKFIGELKAQIPKEGERIKHGCEEEQFEYYECPFCGGEAFITPTITNHYEPRFTVFCKECNAKSKYCKDEESAIAAWNRRTNDAE